MFEFLTVSICILYCFSVYDVVMMKKNKEKGEWRQKEIKNERMKEKKKVSKKERKKWEKREI